MWNQNWWSIVHHKAGVGDVDCHWPSFHFPKSYKHIQFNDKHNANISLIKNKGHFYPLAQDTHVKCAENVHLITYSYTVAIDLQKQVCHHKSVSSIQLMIAMLQSIKPLLVYPFKITVVIYLVIFACIFTITNMLLLERFQHHVCQT